MDYYNLMTIPILTVLSALIIVDNLAYIPKWNTNGIINHPMQCWASLSGNQVLLLA